MTLISMLEFLAARGGEFSQKNRTSQEYGTSFATEFLRVQKCIKNVEGTKKTYLHVWYHPINVLCAWKAGNYSLIYDLSTGTPIKEDGEWKEEVRKEYEKIRKQGIGDQKREKSSPNFIETRFLSVT